MQDGKISQQWNGIEQSDFYERGETMSKFWEIYENMQEVVYVTDVDTYEVVYINRYGRDVFGVDSIENLQGKRCYEVLQKCSSPCAMCTNSKLKPGEFYEWKYYNGLLGRTFLIKDTMMEMDGRRYRLEIAIDIGETDQQKRALKEFESNETMVNEAVRLALAEPTPELSIEALLRHLGQALKSDRVYIFEETPEHTVKNTYEWCAVGVEPQKEYLQDVPFDVVSVWYDAFHKNENIIIKSLESIQKTEPKIYETLLPQQVDTLVVSPLILNEKIIGFYGVDNPPKEFLNHISVMFLVLGYFIASILKNRNLVERLEKLSFYDQLTGALNRHGMNEFMLNVNHEASIGIVYCDVMGLKRVNDSLGHIAGDNLLVRAYECICHTFPKKTVFRIGGDEFLAMSSDVSKADMEDKICKLRESMADFDVKFAIGSVWEEHCNGRIEELMKLADKRMYEDKAEYYSKHPNDRRK